MNCYRASVSTSSASLGLDEPERLQEIDSRKHPTSSLVSALRGSSFAQRCWAAGRHVDSSVFKFTTGSR